MKSFQPSLSLISHSSACRASFIPRSKLNRTLITQKKKKHTPPLSLSLIVLRFSPGSGFQVLTGSPGFGRVSCFFKSKRHHFSKKKKKQKSTGLQPGLAGSTGLPGQLGHTGFFLPLFFLQPGPVPASGRPGPGSARQAGPGFKTMLSLVGLVRVSSHSSASRASFVLIFDSHFTTI